MVSLKTIYYLLRLQRNKVLKKKQKLILAYYLLTKDRKNMRRYWVQPLFALRHQKGEFFHLYNQLREDPSRFYDCLRMRPSTFDYILSKIQNKIDCVPN